ncbi:MAG TPA: alpha-L-fucosidase [Candidatus Hydrogenedentes bacterium]|nr:alpha-L-fucosidase [Candidatus Hydrogenedentota bacterium]
MVTAMLMVVSCSMFAADAEPAIPRFNDGRDWFFEKRFGLFVHWGLYAIPAWHEQHPYRLHVPREEYEKLIHQFNPVKFNPDAWLDLAEKAGMSYLCITTKHIEGFCLWNTAQTSYNVMNTPYGKDILAQLAEACHRRNFPLCLYYSVVDMHHPNYPNEGRSYEYEKPAPGDQPDLSKYLAFLRAQVTELCTNYSAIHGFWWDGNVVKYQDPSYNALIRSLQPQAVINNRGFDAGDFSTPERDWNDEVNQQLAFTKPTEACQAIGRQSWGYRAEEDYYSDEHLIRSIDKILAKGGNYLLNVGPMADGTMPPEGVRILEKIGAWYNAVKESFDGAPASHLVKNREILLTRKGNTLYVHLNQSPQTCAVYMHPFNVKPKTAVLLNDGRNVETRVDLLPWDHENGKPVLRLYNLPVNDFSDTVIVVKLEFDDPVPWAGK